jgi:hypothetical protein
VQFMPKLLKQEQRTRQQERPQFNLKSTNNQFSVWTTCCLSLKRKWNVISEITTYNK